MSAPFVVYDRGPGRRRSMVTPNTATWTQDKDLDCIARPEGVCWRLAFLAREHHVDAVAGVVTESGAARLLHDEEAA